MTRCTCSSGSNCNLRVRADHVAGRQLAEPFAAAGAVQASGLHPLLKLMQLDPSHESLDGQDEAIVEIMGMVQAILVGQQGIKGRTDLDQAATGLVFAGQAVDLKAEHQADVAEGDFRQQPGEIVAADGGGGGAPLIAIEDANAFAGPTPGEGELLEIGLDLSGFGVALDLLGMGLADIDDGPAFQVVQGDLGGSVARQRFRGCHRPPPSAGCDVTDVCWSSSGSVGSAGWLAAGASALASEGSSGRAAWASWAGGDWRVGVA